MKALHRTRRVTAPLVTSAAFPSRGWRSHAVTAAGPDSGVQVTEHTVTKLVTLNRPKVLNALNIDMVRDIYPRYMQWVRARQAGKPTCIVICGAGGKAFCAGGDVVGLATDKEGTLRKEFFQEEYRLNYLIKTMPMPHVALLDGITMGGGVGLSVHGSHRIVTERTMFAMPETGIGLFPDVGGSIFLPRLPHQGLGMFLALTGERLKGADCLHAGIGTHFVPSERIPELQAALNSITSEAEVDTVVQGFAVPASELPAFGLQPHLDNIAQAFTRPCVQSIITELISAELGGSDWHLQTRKKLEGMSPMSLQVTCAQMRRGLTQTPLENFKMEARIAYWMLHHGTDFDEGIRALLIDKDKNPKWNPATLSEVTLDMLAQYFKPIGEYEWEPDEI